MCYIDQLVKYSSLNPVLKVCYLGFGDSLKDNLDCACLCAPVYCTCWAKLRSAELLRASCCHSWLASSEARIIEGVKGIMSPDIYASIENLKVHLKKNGNVEALMPPAP